jgi:hypothetical protein
MKARIDIDAVVGGLLVHVRAGDRLPQSLVDQWLVSNSLIRAIKQGLVEDDDDLASAPVEITRPPKKPKPVPAMAMAFEEDFGE